jgi:uncharacterized membrane protein YbhN (UPF0104 family)
LEPQPPTDQLASTPDRDAHRLRNGLIWTCGLLLVLLGIGLAVPDLREVLSRAAHATLGWLVIGVTLEILSCLGYVATLRLVLSRGPKREIRWLAWAEMAFGAVVPVGGAGGLAVGAWAMRAWGIPWSRVANRSAVIFLLTSAVNAAVLALAGFGVALGIGGTHVSIWYGLVPGAVAFVGLVLFMISPLVMKDHPSIQRGRIRQVLKRGADWVADTEKVAFKPNWRLLGAVGYLVLDIAVLWACLRAVGVSAPVVAIVAGYQIGYLANLIPIPGGVGVLEGGLLAALLLYGLPAAPTAAAVILYHAIALWVPSIGGLIGFARLRGAVAEGPRYVARAAPPEAVPARQAEPDRTGTEKLDPHVRDQRSSHAISDLAA